MSILIRSRPVRLTSQQQSLHFTVIALRRSVPAGMTELKDLNIPTQAKTGIEWATRPLEASFI